MQIMLDAPRKEYKYDNSGVKSIIFTHEQDYVYESKEEMNRHYAKMLSKGFVEQWNFENYHSYIKIIKEVI